MSHSAIKNRPDSPARAATRHDEDLYTWVQEQVALLRAGRLDAENIAEELSDVGKSEFSKLQSALEIILALMLKWNHQPERRSRSWANAIAAQRGEFSDVLTDNSGLKSRRSEALRRAYRTTRLAASSETNLPSESFPDECPYGWEEILDRPFIYEPLASSGGKHR
ncbi:DUF29 domain-containing protein [Enterovirga aerilata]|uniref:DUF29 domain-containing protein n=1 Tax=Enterovirga aerilata TaxID=2730920 RepID=A0A849I9U4_9HYPH|nr:DUF29 domain-containing protein [Enterovirga sp. DB1703]NNM74614.1 DUF29 domain-containing protein [Enterovirga sp. DB1703]